SPSFLSLAPDLSIQQTAALMKRCTVCVTNDSAPRHIAAAVGTKTVSMIPASNVLAWSLYDRVNYPVLIGDDADPTSLVASISVHDVCSAVEKLLVVGERY
ncbi:MAG TPA: glycosyltransferase family 9 protein, partial [Candidatus Kapabacteria bacterium]|nr:glycosyltransferase family 9 protein [Candidatus Kapabacteria bacterium]